MATFNYTAKALDGTIKKSTMDALDQDRLEQKLRSEGLFLLTCKEVKQKTGANRIKAMEISDFCRQIGTMLSSGVSLLRAVDIISKRDIRPNLKNVYQNLGASLQQGLPLHRAMEKEEGAFPELLINMIAAGEASGKLDQTAMKMAEHYEKEYRLHTKLRNVAAYPFILLFVTIIVMVIIFTVVLPNFFTMFEGLELPLTTRMLMALSGALTGYWYLFLLGAALLVGLVVFLLSVPKIRLWFDHLKVRLPWFGKLMRIIYTARFARTLSSLYASGLTMIDALSVSRGTIGNRFIDAQFYSVIEEVRQGQALSSVIAKVNGFDPKLASTIMIGEETGRLDDMLESVADSFDYESDMATQRLTTIMEPILIILLAIIVGFVMFSVILPIYDMYDAIGSGY